MSFLSKNWAFWKKLEFFEKKKKKKKLNFFGKIKPIEKKFNILVKCRAFWEQIWDFNKKIELFGKKIKNKVLKKI